MAWIVLPMLTINDAHAQAPSVPGHLIHAAAVLGVILIYGWFVTRKITQSPLIPTKDPMLHEALSHKNYV
jgi:hypothetical protein